MLSCKNCGAQMSGIDLVCKKCGTPWGKKHKSRKRIYFSLILIATVSYIFFTPNIDKTPLIELYRKYSGTQNDENNNLVENIDERDNTKTPTPVDEQPNEVQEKIPSEPEPPGPQKPQEPNSPPSFSIISSSSSLPAEGSFSYSATQVQDNSLKTAWLEGVKGDGIGEWIKFESDNNQLISNIIIYNGYLKNNSTYLNNGRIKKFSLEFSDGTIQSYDIEKSSFQESSNGYKISFDTPITTSSVKLTVLDVYKGVYYSDLAISEIKFN